MEEAGAEGYRLQEQLDVGNKCRGTRDLVGTTESMRLHIFVICLWWYHVAIYVAARGGIKT